VHLRAALHLDQAATIALFQVASPPQLPVLPQTRPRSFSDLAVTVAISPPGPPPPHRPPRSFSRRVRAGASRLDRPRRAAVAHGQSA